MISVCDLRIAGSCLTQISCSRVLSLVETSFEMRRRFRDVARLFKYLKRKYADSESLIDIKTSHGHRPRQHNRTGSHFPDQQAARPQEYPHQRHNDFGVPTGPVDRNDWRNYDPDFGRYRTPGPRVNDWERENFHRNMGPRPRDPYEFDRWGPRYDPRNDHYYGQHRQPRSL